MHGAKLSICDVFDSMISIQSTIETDSFIMFCFQFEFEVVWSKTQSTIAHSYRYICILMNEDRKTKYE